MRRVIGILLFALTSVVNSQNCDFIFLGELTDFHDGTPLVQAVIYIAEQDRYLTSDLDGKFKIDKLCKGPLTLTISHISCETKTVTYEITGNMFKSIALEHHIEELSEVSVKGRVTRTVTKTAQETVLKSEVLAKYSAMSLGDALKEVPGVSSLNTGSTIVKPMINGLFGSRLLVLTNGVRLQDQEWGVEHAPNIDINSADQISVIKGSGALAFGGDAIGGVIIMNPKRVMSVDTLYGHTILGGQSNGWGYNINSAINKSFENGWFANAQGSFKQNGDFRAPDYNLTNTGSKSGAFTLHGGKRTFESGFEVFYSYINSEIGILRAAHIGSVRDLERAINAGQPLFIRDFSYDINVPKQDVTHHLAKLGYYKRFQNFGKLTLQYDYQNNRRLEFDVRRGNLREIPAVDLELQTHTLLADVNMDSKPNYDINFGLMYRYQDNFANPDTGVRRLIPDYDKYDAGVYFTGEWRPKDELVVDFGLRYDFNRIDAKKFYLKSRWEERGYDEDFSDIIIEEFPTQYLTNPIFDYHNFSASAGLKYDMSENSYVLASYALASRPPNPSELFSDGLHHAAARFEFGDLRFNQEISNRIGVTYSYSGRNLSLLAEVFYNKINDFMYLRPFDFISTIRGPFPLWQYEQTDAEMFGFDLRATYQITSALQFQNKSALIKGYDLEDNVPLIDIPPFSTINSINYNYNEWNNLVVGIQNEWVFEQNEYPDFNFEITDLITGEDIEIDISTPPPAYTLFHLYGEATFDLTDKSTLNMTLAVNNIFDMNYRNYLNRLRFFADELGRNITLQFKLNF
jgi:iron complex outermembrane receptor protein